VQLASFRYFLKVAECRSVRQAADRVHITPSAVSRHIATLENVIGSPLFERRRPGMVLTPEGEILQRYAEKIISDIESAKSAASDIKGLKRGVIRVFAMEAIVEGVLHPAMRDFKLRNPDVIVAVEVISKANRQVSHALARGEAEIGIMYKISLSPDIESLAEFDTPFSVIAAPGHPLANRSVIFVADLADTAVAALSASTATRRITEGAMRSNGVVLHYVVTVNSFEMAKAFARTGVGVTILPTISVKRECEAGELVAIPLGDWNLRRTRTTICALRGQDLSNAAKEFVATLKRHSVATPTS
jgi:DNA-binding transcriptional LysR family regulator